MNMRRVKSDRHPRTAIFDFPRVEVGEIDTRAPFKSVKAAVSLFGEAALSKAKHQNPTIKPKHSSENIVNRETELLWLEKEFKNIKRKLERAENTKSKAGNDLERAKDTLQDLTKRLEAVSKSKQSAVQVAEELKEHSWKLQLQNSNNSGEYKEHKMEMDTAKEKYTALTTELLAAKQQMNEIRRNMDAAMETKLAAVEQAADAQSSAHALSERAKELYKEVSDMKEAIQQVTLASEQVYQESVNIAVGKDPLQIYYMRAKEDVEMKLISAKKDYDPEQAERLLEKLNETNAKVEAIQEEMKKAYALEMDSAKSVTEELSEASITLQKIVDEETSLRRSVINLRQNLKEVKKQQAELREKEAERDRAVAGQEPNASNIFEEIVRVQELSTDILHIRKEAEEMKKNAQQLKREAEAAQKAEEEAKKNLDHALKQAKEAKAAELKALEEMHVLSRKQGTANYEASRTIKISTEEFHSLDMKIVDSRNMADAKVTAANYGLQTINARRAETNKRLEEMSLALQGIEIATELAEDSATMEEAAHKVLEDELKSLR